MHHALGCLAARPVDLGRLRPGMIAAARPGTPGATCQAVNGTLRNTAQSRPVRAVCDASWREELMVS